MSTRAMIQSSKGRDCIELILNQKNHQDSIEPLMNGAIRTKESIEWDHDQIKESSGIVHKEKEAPIVFVREGIVRVILLVVEEP